MFSFRFVLFFEFATIHEKCMEKTQQNALQPQRHLIVLGCASNPYYVQSVSVWNVTKARAHHREMYVWILGKLLPHTAFLRRLQYSGGPINLI